MDQILTLNYQDVINMIAVAIGLATIPAISLTIMVKLANAAISAFTGKQYIKI